MKSLLEIVLVLWNTAGAALLLCGCAAQVESPRFSGLNVVKQHKLVQGVLKAEIAEMHGFTLKTAKPQ